MHAGITFYLVRSHEMRLVGFGYRMAAGSGMIPPPRYIQVSADPCLNATSACHLDPTRILHHYSIGGKTAIYLCDGTAFPLLHSFPVFLCLHAANKPITWIHRTCLTNKMVRETHRSTFFLRQHAAECSIQTASQFLLRHHVSCGASIQN